MIVTSASSLQAFQELNKEIYRRTNDRNFDDWALFCYVLRHVTRGLKNVRKKDHKTTQWHLCMALSWSLGLFNRLHVNLASRMWKAFPGHCPYCLTAPCSCSERRQERLPPKEPSCQEPKSICQWQEMFARIYPGTLQESAIHLAEETGEVGEALRNFLATHRKAWFEKTVEEMIDLVTNIFAVANRLNIDLAGGMAHSFEGGCPGCLHQSCRCKKIIVDPS